MIRYDNYGLLRNTYFAHFHASGSHFKRLSSPYNVVQKRIPTLQNSSDCIFLIVFERYLRIHSRKLQITAVKRRNDRRVIYLIVFADKILTTMRFIKYPFFESGLQLLLPFTDGYRFLLIHDTLFLSVRILYFIRNSWRL